MHGFIYFHRIRDVRVGGTATRNIRMFSSLCGPEAMKNVAIVTTRWDELQSEKQLQVARNTEEELLDTHFKEFTHSHAQVHRHNNTLESAQAIMSSLLRCRPIGKIRVVAEILSGKTLPETEAGLELEEQLVQLMSHYQDDLNGNNLRAAIQSNNEAHEEEIAKLLREFEKVKKDHEALQLLAKVKRRKRRCFGFWSYDK